MGEIHIPEQVQLIVAAFAAEEDALAWGKARAVEAFGPIWRESPTFFFNEFTDYYAEEMGAVLPKRFWAFERLIKMDELAAIKVATNSWEDELARGRGEGSCVRRPLNLDPGYIDQRPPAPDLPAERDLRRNDSLLLAESVAEAPLDLPRLPERRISGIFHRMPRPSAAAPPGKKSVVPAAYNNARKEKARFLSGLF